VPDSQRAAALADFETPSRRFWLRLFQRLRVGGLSVLVRELAVFLSGLGVLLRLLVFTHRVVMLGLKMVMCGRVVMTSRVLMVLRRRMFRHLSTPLLRIASDPKVNRSIFPC
jgi:hypothetical protein